MHAVAPGDVFISSVSTRNPVTIPGTVVICARRARVLVRGTGIAFLELENDRVSNYVTYIYHSYIYSSFVCM